MGYAFGEDHYGDLRKALHALRWSDLLPEEVDGLNCNLLLETAVDGIFALEKRAQDAETALMQWWHDPDNPPVYAARLHDQWTHTDQLRRTAEGERSAH